VATISWPQPGRNKQIMATAKTAAATVRSGNKTMTSSTPLLHSSNDGITIGGGHGGVDMDDGEGIRALAVVMEVLLPTMVEATID